jgi:DNA replication protein DnaC
MIAPDQDLDALFKRLHLANARRVWRDLVQRAERESWSYRDFLTLLVTEEIAHRQQTRLDRLTRRAQFPFLKTIDDFNFTYQSTLRLHMLGSALAADFVTEGRTLIFSGKTGRGKTHLAIAIAYRAIQNGFDAFFTTAAALIDDLSAAFRQGQLAEALTLYTHPAVLVVDEIGYLTYGTDAANMLFHVVNERHRRRRSMIFTTNKALKAWGRVLHDEDLGQAIIDRVLERGRLIRLDGPSVRTLHLKLDDALKDDSDQDDEVARISGNKWPEFPEPTRVSNAVGGMQWSLASSLFAEALRAQLTQSVVGPFVMWLKETDQLRWLYAQLERVSEERRALRHLESGTGTLGQVVRLLDDARIRREDSDLSGTVGCERMG